MPLDQVQKGMSCTGYSVVQGTDISSFDVSVVDVVTGDAGSGTPEILVRVSGPAVDASGIANGFSGSPIYCPDAQGVQRNIGAISQGIGEYGNKLVLATPIESILGQPVQPPANARSDPALMRRARPLSEPLVVSGVSPGVASYFARAAARAGRALYAAPAGPPRAFPVQTLRPGSSMAVGLASGDVSAGAIGTVAYIDGPNVWGFGHQLDAAGRRSLLLEDAYVYAIVDNPLGIPDVASSYKLAAPGHAVGTLTGDGQSAVTGVVGAIPSTIPLRVLARRTDIKRGRTLTVSVADETGVGLTTGASPMATVAPLAVAEADSAILDGTRPVQSGSMCVLIGVRELPKPMRFCNTYVTPGASGGAGSPVGDVVGDVSQAMMYLDDYAFAPPHITGVEVDLNLAPGLAQAYMLSAQPLSNARPGRRLRLRLAIARVRGATSERTITVPVPRGARPGPALLLLKGTAADSSGSSATAGLITILTGSGSPSSSSGSSGLGTDNDPGPLTIAGLSQQIASIHRFDGVTARFVSLSGGAGGLSGGAHGAGATANAGGIAAAKLPATKKQAKRTPKGHTGAFRGWAYPRLPLRQRHDRRAGPHHRWYAVPPRPPAGRSEPRRFSILSGINLHTGDRRLGNVRGRLDAERLGQLTRLVHLGDDAKPDHPAIGTAAGSWASSTRRQLSPLADARVSSVDAQQRAPACRAATVRAEKPHPGCSGVPFMNSSTGFCSIACVIASRIGFESWLRSSIMKSSLAQGLQGKGVDGAADLVAEHVVDHAMLREPVEPRERGRDHRGLEMVPAAGVVLHLGAGSRDPHLDALADLLSARHASSRTRLRRAASLCSGQRGYGGQRGERRPSVRPSKEGSGPALYFGKHLKWRLRADTPNGRATTENR